MNGQCKLATPALPLSSPASVTATQVGSCSQVPRADTCCSCRRDLLAPYYQSWGQCVVAVSCCDVIESRCRYFNAFGGWWYINRMNAELAKMAARGFTVIAGPSSLPRPMLPSLPLIDWPEGSGDAGTTNVGEMGNDLSPTDPTCTPFRPFFPRLVAYTIHGGYLTHYG